MISEIEIENDSGEISSSYLQYLPAFYREDDFTGRFLRIFEDILSPMEKIIENLAYYFDPGTTPSSFLSWLATWVGLTQDERWLEIRKRQLISSVVELYMWRGTKKGLSDYLRLYTGVTPRIIEPADVESIISSREKKATGISQSEADEIKPNCFMVILDVPESTTVDPEIVRSIIEIQKPAHTAYILKINKQKA